MEKCTRYYPLQKRFYSYTCIHHSHSFGNYTFTGWCFTTFWKNVILSILFFSCQRYFSSLRKYYFFQHLKCETGQCPVLLFTMLNHLILWLYRVNYFYKTRETHVNPTPQIRFEICKEKKCFSKNKLFGGMVYYSAFSHSRKAHTASESVLFFTQFTKSWRMNLKQH